MRRLKILLVTLGMLTSATVVAPASVAAAASGCQTSTVRVYFDVTKNWGTYESSGWVKHSIYWCWNGEFTRLDEPQTTSYYYPAGTSVTRTFDNHDLWLNQFDRSIQTNWDISKTFCVFDLDVELQLDNDTGNTWRGIRTDSTHGPGCAGWDLRVTSIASS